MAIVNYGVQSPDLTLSVQMELSDADSARIIAYLMAATPHGTVTENVQREELNPAWSPDQPDPSDPPPSNMVQEWVSRPATPKEALTSYADCVMRAILAESVTWARAMAATEAAAAVAPITPIKPPAPVPGE